MGNIFNPVVKKIIAVVVALIILAVFLVAFLNRLSKLNDQKKSISNLESSVTEMSENNSKLEETLKRTDDEDYMSDRAYEEGYVAPEDRIYYNDDVS